MDPIATPCQGPRFQNARLPARYRVQGLAWPEEGRNHDAPQENLRRQGQDSVTRLNAIGVHNHFIKRMSLREQLIKEVEIIPLEVVCRNIAAGSLSKRFGIPEGQALPRSIIEFYLKDDKLGDPMVAEEHVTAFNWAQTQEIDDMMAMTLRVNDFLCGMFGAVGITLVDFKVEYGRVWENDFSRVLLADEISPDSCRLWDSATNEKLDKDRFRRDLGNVIESYTEVARRLGIMKEMPTVIQGGIH
jgi:phosphoribosylaminoimidazole-succinocarboxamide synthase